MKKNINIEEILDNIAIEKAPEDLIYKWKVEVVLQKERKRFFSMLFRPAVIFPIILVGLWYYFVIFRTEQFEYYLMDKVRLFLLKISPAFANSLSAIVCSNYYIIGVGIFSVFLAAVSLFWFYQGKKLRCSKVRIW